jgi:hypothetical protein
MSWQIFKNEVLSAMASGPPDSATVAKVIANSYNKVVTSPSSGDLLFKNPVERGNVEALEKWLEVVFQQQSVSPVQLPIINLFVTGFIQYWTGATLKKTNIPYVPAPGSVKNLQVVSIICTNPGAPVSISYSLNGISQIEPFIDKLIDAARQHLLTVSGVCNTMSLYGAPPTQTTGPGVVPWNGFSAEPQQVTPEEKDAYVFDTPVEVLEADADDSVVDVRVEAKEFHSARPNTNDNDSNGYRENIPDSQGKPFQKEDILEYYGQDVGFASQKTNWACLVTSISNLLKRFKIKDSKGQDVVNESTFIKFNSGYQYSDSNSAYGKYMNGNNFDSGTFFADAPKLLNGKFTRIRKNIDTATSQKDVYDAYKRTLSAIKQPMIIRVAGASRRGRGHFVVMVGITKQGEIIVRDCSNSKVAKADRTYTVGRMLASKEQESGNNCDVMYFTPNKK